MINGFSPVSGTISYNRLYFLMLLREKLEEIFVIPEISIHLN